MHGFKPLETKNGDNLVDVELFLSQTLPQVICPTSHVDNGQGCGNIFLFIDL